MDTISKLFLFILACSVVLTGCSSESNPQQKNDVIFGKLVLSNGWARPGSQGQTSGVYLKIDNGTATQDTLLGVSSTLAQKAEIHESYTTENNIMNMRPVGRQVIESGNELLLEPGGFHIMLINLKQDLAVGDSVDVSLKFSRVGTRSIKVPVKIQK